VRQPGTYTEKKNIYERGGKNKKRKKEERKIYKGL
jgi:hypothetical protein